MKEETLLNLFPVMLLFLFCLLTIGEIQEWKQLNLDDSQNSLVKETHSIKTFTQDEAMNCGSFPEFPETSLTHSISMNSGSWIRSKRSRTTSSVSHSYTETRNAHPGVSIIKHGSQVRSSVSMRSMGL